MWNFLTMASIVASCTPTLLLPCKSGGPPWGRPLDALGVGGGVANENARVPPPSLPVVRHCTSTGPDTTTSRGRPGVRCLCFMSVLLRIVPSDVIASAVPSFQVHSTGMVRESDSSAAVRNKSTQWGLATMSGGLQSALTLVRSEGSVESCTAATCPSLWLANPIGRRSRFLTGGAMSVGASSR